MQSTGKEYQLSEDTSVSYISHIPAGNWLNMYSAEMFSSESHLNDSARLLHAWAVNHRLIADGWKKNKQGSDSWVLLW